MVWMESRTGKRRGGSVSKAALLCCVSIFLFSGFALISSGYSGDACLDIRSSSTDSYTQRGTRRRQLTSEGLGSYPPRCTSKCGDCTPCFPVHVPVPPGTPVIAEYYPEAWRCKCGNKLYIP